MYKKVLSMLIVMAMLFSLITITASAEEYPCWFYMQIWTDSDYDDIPDTNGQVANATVKFIDKKGSTITVKSDDSGSVYQELVPGDYKIRVELPGGYEFYEGRFDDYVSGGPIYADVTSIGKLEFSYTAVQSRQVGASLILNEMSKGYLGVTVWNDTNKNRQMYVAGKEYEEFEAGESPILGATVTVKNSAGKIEAKMQTDEFGTFGVELNPLSEYTIEIKMPIHLSTLVPVSNIDAKRTITTKIGDESMEEFYFASGVPNGTIVDINSGNVNNTTNGSTNIIGGTTTNNNDGSNNTTNGGNNNNNANTNEDPFGVENEEDPDGKDDPKGDETEDPDGDKKDDPKGDEKEDPDADKKDDPKGDEKEDSDADKKDDPKGDETEDGTTSGEDGTVPDADGTTPGKDGVTPGTSDTGMLVDSPDAPKVTAKLNKEEHYAYVMGYPDGLIMPEANITREEVATIFFRLLTDETRDICYSKTNTFKDVASTWWSNTAISTMANAGVLGGYSDGTFLPEANITRAEFATIAARFDSQSYIGPDKFNDISGHWAAEYINRAAMKGWISGYHDGSFKPDAYITRAEAMTLINNVLERHVKKEGMLAEMIKWPDCNETDWFYGAVSEATNSHYYEKTGKEEKWTQLRETRNWAELEK